MMPHTAVTLLAVLALFVGEHKLSQAQTIQSECSCTVSVSNIESTRCLFVADSIIHNNSIMHNNAER